MNVGELIARLRKFPEEMPVFKFDDADTDTPITDVRRYGPMFHFPDRVVLS